MANRKRKTDKRAKKKAEKARKKHLRARGVKFTTSEDGKIIPTSIPLDPETIRGFKEMEQRYIAKTGHPIPEDMTLGEVFNELTGENFEESYLPGLLEAMWNARIEPAKIYATWKSDGLLPTQENMDLIDPEVLEEFDQYLDEFDDLVDQGENPFTGSVLKEAWEREGTDRLAAIAGNELDESDQEAPELPVPIPFTKGEWSGKTISQITEDQRFFTYYSDSIAQAHKSGRARRYIDVFTMITHIGRFPEFSRKNYDKFLEEARAQPMTAQRLRSALEIVLSVSGPSEVLPTAASAFEFLAVVGEFGRFMAKQIDAGSAVEDLLANLEALAMMAFIIAVNVELGLADRKAWQIPHGRN